MVGKSHGQRSLVGYSPEGYRESDTTEQLNIHTYLKLTYLRLGWKTHFHGWQADVGCGLEATVPSHVETYTGPLEHPHEGQLVSPETVVPEKVRQKLK